MVRHLGPQGRLLDPLRPFLLVADLRMRAALPDQGLDGADARAVWAGARRWLAECLIRLAARTLVEELGAARRAGTLSGTDKRRRFDDFVRGICARGALTDLLHRHPVLARLIAERCLNTVAAAAELLERFEADREQLVAALLGDDPGPLVRARFGLSDPHTGGRTVVVLEFRDGRQLVHKPRPLGLHARWNDLLGWFAGHCPELAPRAVRLLCKDGYGWAEFVSAQPCRSAADVARFYRRTGALLALLYAVDATDIHAENLIAAADHPVVVDVETLFHPCWVPRTDGGRDPATYALAASVHRTLLLPHWVTGDFGALDVSAVGARAGEFHPDASAGWEEAGTDAMRLVRGPAPFHPGDNRPVLDGTPADPAEHVECLLAGFRTAYRTILAHTDELTGPRGLLDGFARAWTRLVVRPSQTYAGLLGEATCPKALRDLTAREGAFAALFAETGHGHLRRLAGEELADLVAGDIPVFAARADSCDVRTSRGRELTDVLAVDGLTAATARIRGMGPRDLRRQEWLIEAALATRRPAPPHAARGGRAARTDANTRCSR
ncbi:type 2 lanthipeptide synthetase LanM family protein, partial [Streptomyces beihaiensis]